MHAVANVLVVSPRADASAFMITSSFVRVAAVSSRYATRHTSSCPTSPHARTGGGAVSIPRKAINAKQKPLCAKSLSLIKAADGGAAESRVARPLRVRAVAAEDEDLLRRSSPLLEERQHTPQMIDVQRVAALPRA